MKTNEEYKEYFIYGGAFSLLNEEEKTKQASIIYIQEHGDLSEVPDNLIDEELCYSYIKKDGYLCKVPVKYQTTELCNLFLDKNNIKKIDDLQLRFVEYVKNNGKIANVPDKYKTTDLLNVWLDILCVSKDDDINKRMFKFVDEKLDEWNSLPEFYKTKELQQYFEKKIKIVNEH